MPSIAQSSRLPGLIISFVLSLAAALGINRNGSLAQDQAAVGLPEAYEIQDITSLGCEIETIEYAGFNPDNREEPYFDPISRSIERCPQGSVLHKFPTTVAEAEARGLPYVVLTGDQTTDLAAVEDLKQTLLPVASVAMTAQKSSSALPAAACSNLY